MAGRGVSCAFCSATRPPAEIGVLDEKWTARYGGTPVLALDHGWYRSSAGGQVQADNYPVDKSFRPYVRAACDRCVHGWIEDLRWRAEPTLLALAEGRDLQPPARTDPASLVRWAQLTALLAELAPGMPTAGSVEQRHAVQVGAEPELALPVWFFSLRQRLPARVHLSQIEGPAHIPNRSFIQVVSIDVARFSALVVIPTDAAADAVVRQSCLTAEFGLFRDPQDRSGLAVHDLDLAHTPHPQRIAVQRLCAASTGSHAGPAD